MMTKFKIEKFNGTNFSLWKLKMKAISRKDNCLEAIDKRPAEITDDNKWNEMDGNAMANIHLALADNVLSSIEEKKIAKEIWDHLIKLYEAKSLHNKIFLKRKLYTLRMSGSTLMTEHMNTLNTLFSQLTLLGYKIEPNKCAELLLQSLPDSYDQLVINLTNNILTDYLSFDDVVATVLEEENRCKNKEDKLVSSQQAEVLTVTRVRPLECNSSGSKNQGRSKSQSKKNMKCYNCGKKGHVKKNCWNLNKKDSNPQGNVASTINEGSVLSCKAVTTMEGQLDDLDCKVVVEKRLMKVIQGVLVLMKRRKVDANLYMLEGETLQEGEASVASSSSGENLSMMWHRKLGHMSEQGLKFFVEQNLLPELTKVSLPFCEHCVTSKQHRLKFNTSSSRSKMILELVHYDVWQSLVTSLGGARYFVFFIDDYSKRCWVYPIKKKTDVYSVFKVFKVQVELQYGKKIKCLRTDNGGEYIRNEFVEFCNQEGIKRQFTAAYTPQQNGVAQRMNRTLLERTRAMLGAVGLKKAFWAKAVNTGYRLWDPTVHKVIISKDVIFMEDKKQVADDSTVNESSRIATVHVEKESVDDSFEVGPMHEIQ
ncbi:hypothetical protein E5676_scaffold21G003420 [Cucumis melo var. makuwa]|uniref:Retrovirus-related Pol polyprotein from transposon TNT 1-94 n=1 Tax=Cucumis melo var. makuwa TaxID=1194695 RepID=A0A5D3CXA6_CUCMM|nr:hypothetical protein E5676_scaffold21G003420 [Cucumis melo var. makuwa]